MARQADRVLSRRTGVALEAMGALIRLRRKAAKVTVAELAERAGVTRGLITRIEAGEATTAIGTVFEVATLLGVDLFGLDEGALRDSVRDVEQRLVLMPQRVRTPKLDLVDDF